MTSAEERGRCMSVVDLCENTNEVTVRLPKGSSHTHHGSTAPGAGGGGGSGRGGGGGGGQGGGGVDKGGGGVVASSTSSKVFRFDGVCPVSTTQQQLFEKHVQPLVDEVLQGFNCTVFAYGQTGTGKTYTVEGAQGLNGTSVYQNLEDVAQDSDCGLVARSVQRIFSSLRQQNRPSSEYSVFCSFLEIYNEELVDLFASPSPSSSAPTSGTSSSSAPAGFVSASNSQASTASDLPALKGSPEVSAAPDVAGAAASCLQGSSVSFLRPADSQASTSSSTPPVLSHSYAQPRLRIYEDLSNSIPSLGPNNGTSSSSSSSSSSFSSRTAVSGASSSSSAHPQQGRGVVRVDGLEEKEVHSEKDVFNLLRQAAPRRSFAASSANARSSRSHTIFSISVCIRESAARSTDLDHILADGGAAEETEGFPDGRTLSDSQWRRQKKGSSDQKKTGGSTGSKSGGKERSFCGDGGGGVGKPGGVHTPEEEVIRIGKLNLVDLAGSENVYKSWGSTAEERRRREALTINKSLLTLGRCINALVDHSSYIPYRDSKLTRLLQDSLGGCTKTCLIATISPADDVVEETINTLDYAYRAKSIQNIPVKTLRHSKSLLLSSLLNENQQLKLLLSSQREKDGVFLPLPIYQQQELKLVQQEEDLRLCHAELQKKRNEVSLLSTRLEKLARLEGEYEKVQKEREDLQGLYDKTARDLAIAHSCNQGMREKITRLKRKEAFLTESFLAELRREKTAVSFVRKSLHEAIVDLLKVCEYRKMLERRHGSVRKTCRQFGESLDQSLTSFLEKQENLDVKLRELLEGLLGLERERSVWVKASNEDFERLYSDQICGSCQKTHARRGESLRKVLKTIETNEEENEKAFHGFKGKLTSCDALGKSQLTNTWASAKKILLDCYEEQERRRSRFEKSLYVKDAQEAKQLGQLHQLVAKWGSQESKHAANTCGALEQLAAQLATWRETQERDFEEGVVTRVMASVQESLKVLFREIKDENQKKVEREVQSLQQQLVQIRHEQLAQLDWTETASREVTGATEGLNQVGREKTRETLQTLEDLVHTAQEGQQRGERLLADAQEEVDRLWEERTRLRDHLDQIQTQMSSEHRSVQLAVGEILSQDERDLREVEDTFKKASLLRTKQQEKDEKMHVDMAKSLEAIQSLASEARDQRRGNVEEKQQRAGAFVREILTQLPVECSVGMYSAKGRQGSPPPSRSPASAQSLSSSSPVRLLPGETAVALSERRKQRAPDSPADESLRQADADNDPSPSDTKESSEKTETLSTASQAVSGACSCKECLVKDVEERWGRVDLEKTRQDSIEAIKAVEDLSKLPEILRNRFHVLEEDTYDETQRDTTCPFDESTAVAEVANSSSGRARTMEGSIPPWQSDSAVLHARDGDLTTRSDSCSVSTSPHPTGGKEEGGYDTRGDQKKGSDRWMRKARAGTKVSPYQAEQGHEKPSVFMYGGGDDEENSMSTPDIHLNAEKKWENGYLLARQSPAGCRTRSLSEDSESATSSSSSSTATPCATLPYELSPLPPSPIPGAKARPRQSPSSEGQTDGHQLGNDPFEPSCRDRLATDKNREAMIQDEESEQDSPANLRAAPENTRDKEAENVTDGGDKPRTESDENSPPSQEGSSSRVNSQEARGALLDQKMATTNRMKNASSIFTERRNTGGKRVESLCGGSQEQLSSSKSAGSLSERKGGLHNAELPVLGSLALKNSQQSRPLSDRSSQHDRVATTRTARPHSSLSQKQKWTTDGKVSRKKTGGLEAHGGKPVKGGEHNVSPPTLRNRSVFNTVPSASPESGNDVARGEKQQGLRRVRSDDALVDLGNEKKKVSKTGNVRTVLGGAVAALKSGD